MKVCGGQEPHRHRIEKVAIEIDLNATGANHGLRKCGPF